jgi:hypothetical protein
MEAIHPQSLDMEGSVHVQQVISFRMRSVACVLSVKRRNYHGIDALHKDPGSAEGCRKLEGRKV